jgi:serine protease Do
MLKRFFAVITFSLITTIQPVAFAGTLPDFTVLAEQHGGEVVNISVTQSVPSQGDSPFKGFPQDEKMKELFERFGIPFPGAPAPNQGGGNTQPNHQSKSLGSGFIISADGYILTNAHVVNGADEVIVKLASQREFKAKLIGSDKRTDVALVKIEATGLPVATLGDPSKLKVGEWVAAIGSPFGLENTMTQGIVSAKGRALPQENFVPFIQTDVAINPGNSGGPLYNLSGEVVGINSQIYSRSGGSVGLSFAIPIDVAIDVSNQLKSSGKVTRGWLGVAIQSLTKELAESFGMNDDNGALIAGVEPNSPAAKGGLETGDVITKFNGAVITESGDLPRVVGATKPGKVVPVQVFRKGKVKLLNVAIGTMPTEGEEVAVAPKKTQEAKSNKIGLTLKALTAKQKKKLDGKNGLLVLASEGQAAEAGIRRGDVVLGLNNNETQSVDLFNKQINAVKKGKTIAVLVFRNGNTLYVPIKITK